MGTHRAKLTPDEEATWQLLYAIAQCLPGVLDRQLNADARLGHYEYAVLHALHRQTGREATMAFLVEVTAATFSRLSHSIGRLERRGLVEKVRKGPHRRVSLTEEGARTFRLAAAGHMDQIRYQVLDHIPTDRLDQLAELLTPVAEHLRNQIERG